MPRSAPRTARRLSPLLRALGGTAKVKLSSEAQPSWTAEPTWVPFQYTVTSLSMATETVTHPATNGMFRRFRVQMSVLGGQLVLIVGPSGQVPAVPNAASPTLQPESSYPGDS